MSKIEIDKIRDLLIIEKVEGGVVASKGSKIYCGCCGHTIGILGKELTFPFTSATFLESLECKSVTKNIIGLRHSKCEHTMFSFKKCFDFMSLESYNKGVAELKSKDNNASA